MIFTACLREKDIIDRHIERKTWKKSLLQRCLDTSRNIREVNMEDIFHDIWYADIGSG